MPDTALIIGGGLAGLAAAQALGEAGLRVTLLEARPRLGGRAGSFHDAASGQLLDACQHVSMGVCTNFAHFCRAAGIAHLLAPQPALYFMTPDRRVSELRAGALPAPLHLAGSFLRAHYLTAAEKARVAWGLACLRATPAGADPPLLDWLMRHGQTRRTVERFWGVVLVSALNEVPARLGLKYARKVFVEAFLRHRRGFQVEVPTVPLGRLYGPELEASLGRAGVAPRLGEAVRCLHVEGGRVAAAELRSAERVTADWYVTAVPFDRLADLLPAEVTAGHAYFAGLSQLETSPITSVHLWYDRPVLPYPHVVLIDSVGQWAFSRGEAAPGEDYVQVVVSAARELRELGHDEVRRRIVAELAALFPEATPRRLLRSRVVTERAATFSAVPGVDRLRPPQASPLPNLLVAGDWTATGWPATMEGAVRSGYLAAEALLARQGRRARLVRPGL